MIKRTILDRLREHLERPEVTILIGPRQVGKTYLMKILQEHLESHGKKTVFLSLDIENDKRFFRSQQSLVDYLRLQFGDSHGYVFIDEIQRKDEAGLFLKGIYDMNLGYKFIVSGSGSLDIKAKVKESMAGRKRLFLIDPISFEEFTNFKTVYRYEDKLSDFFAIEKIKTRAFLEEYMLFGGYPKVILAETADTKRSEMDEIFLSYIERDITSLLDVEKPEALTQLLKIIASQIGSLVNVSELSSTLGVSSKTIQRYLWYLEQTLILKKVTPYHRNVRSEISKAPIYYFYDPGLRNYLMGIFGLASVPATLSGHLFENIVFNILREHLGFTSTSIHFWRTRDRAEVDFVIDTGQKVIPVEAKYQALKKPEVTRSYRSFLSKYRPARGYIVHLGERFEYEVQDTKVAFLPYFESIKMKF